MSGVKCKNFLSLWLLLTNPKDISISFYTSHFLFKGYDLIDLSKNTDSPGQFDFNI